MQVKLESLKYLDEAERSKVTELIVFDFDDTVAKTESNVIVKDKETGEEVEVIPSHEFPGHKLKPGREYDFREFDLVTNPKELPDTIKLFKHHLKDKNNRGKEVSILTARGPNSAPNIRKYLRATLGKSADIDWMPIVGLGSSSAQSKADWILERVKDYGNVKTVKFIDDAKKNREAVEALNGNVEMHGVTVTVEDPARLHEPESYKKVAEIKTKKCEGAGCGKRRKVLLNVKLGA
jgi:hypothetical protein